MYCTAPDSSWKDSTIDPPGPSRKTAKPLGPGVSPDGRSAQVVSHVRSEIASADRVRRLCAVRAQTLMLAGGAVRSTGQTDTYLPCPLLARAVTPDWLNRLGRR